MFTLLLFLINFSGFFFTFSSPPLIHVPFLIAHVASDHESAIVSFKGETVSSVGVGYEKLFVLEAETWLNDNTATAVELMSWLDSLRVLVGVDVKNVVSIVTRLQTSEKDVSLQIPIYKEYISCYFLCVMIIEN